MHNTRLLEIIDTTENDMFLNNQKNGNTLRKLYKIKRQAGLNYRLLSISGEWVNNVGNQIDAQFCGNVTHGI
jgi:hypothetical protein